MLSVSVESAMECQMTCYNDVFLRCVFELDDVKFEDHCSVLLEKTPLAATQAFSMRTQALPMFSNIQRLPVHVPGYTRVKSARNFAGLAGGWMPTS